MKVKAKQLTYEDFGNRIIYTDEKSGTSTTRVISGVSSFLGGSFLNAHVPAGQKPYIKATYLITKVTFLDGTSIAVAGDSLLEIDADTTPLEVQVTRPNQTGLR